MGLITDDLKAVGVELGQVPQIPNLDKENQRIL